MNKSSSSRFVIENGRLTRINRRDKVTFLTVLASHAKGNQFLDVTTFAAPAGLEDGQSVTIKGDVSMRGPGRNDPPGTKWTIQLIAREFLPGDENLTPAMPQQKAAAKESAPAEDDSSVPF